MKETTKNAWKQRLHRFSESTIQLIMFLVAVLAFSVFLLEMAVLTALRHQPVSDTPSPMVAEAANQFKAQKGWRMESEEALTQEGVCLVGHCSYVQQVWDIGKQELDCPTLQQLLTDSKYSLNVRKDNPESCTSSVALMYSEAAAAAGTVSVKLSVTHTGAGLGLPTGGEGNKLILFISQKA